MHNVLVADKSLPFFLEAFDRKEKIRYSTWSNPLTDMMSTLSPLIYGVAPDDGGEYELLRMAFFVVEEDGHFVTARNESSTTVLYHFPLLEYSKDVVKSIEENARKIFFEYAVKTGISGEYRAEFVGFLEEPLSVLYAFILQDKQVACRRTRDADTVTKTAYEIIRR